jgi:chromate transporter
MKTLLLVCYEFFKTGLFAVGGGLATIPFLKDIAARYGWYSMKELTTMIAVSESTPGSMGINMATYVGNHVAGVIGGILSTLSLVAPSIIVIIIVAHMLEKFQDSEVVQGVFSGLRPAVIGFIISAVVDIYLGALFRVDLFRDTGKLLNLFNWTAIVLFAVLLAVYKKFPKLHPVIIIVVAAVAGIVLKL